MDARFTTFEEDGQECFAIEFRPADEADRKMMRRYLDGAELRFFTYRDGARQESVLRVETVVHDQQVEEST